MERSTAPTPVKERQEKGMEMGRPTESPAQKGEDGPTAIYTVDLKADPPACQEFSEGKVQCTAPLEPGPDGLLIAKFPGHLWKSVLPNLALESVKAKKEREDDVEPMKRAPPRRKAMKAMKAPPMKAMKAAPPKGNPGKYNQMFYKNTHTIGIREKTGGKKQVCSFGGAKAKKQRNRT